tara:strand:- start:96 stop:812 length:717 start_codon:yes stop_codon:yes gene_type:complete
MKKRISCPKCKSELILDITYGYPSEDSFKDESFFSGGCCLDSDSPAYHCKSCGYEFGYAIPDDENNIHDRELRKLFENNLEEWDKIRSDCSYYEHKDLYAKAFSIALDAHENQYDKGGCAYIHHCLKVMDWFSNYEERIVALLHDVVEDSKWTLEKLKEEGFSDKIIEAIDSVTRRKSEDYFDFIARAKQNEIGLRVKLADLAQNSMIKRIPNPSKEDFERIEKYKKASDILMSVDDK